MDTMGMKIAMTVSEKATDLKTNKVRKDDNIGLA